MRRAVFAVEAVDRIARRLSGRHGPTEEVPVDLSFVAAALPPERFRYAVMGSAAARCHGLRRPVRDVDLLVHPGDHAVLGAALDAAGLERTAGAWRGRARPLELVPGREGWTDDALEDARLHDGVPVLTLPYVVLAKIGSDRRKSRYDLSRLLARADAGTLERVADVVRRHRPDQSGELRQLTWLGRLELGPSWRR